MKKLYSICILLLSILVSNISFAQKLYDDINPLAFTKGKRLTVGSSTNPLFPGDLISIEYTDTANFNYNVNLYGDYRQWRFSDKLLLGAYAKAGIEYQKAKFNSLGLISSNETKDFNATVYGGASYYLMPDKFYVTGALGVSYGYRKIDLTSSIPQPSMDSTIIPAYLWGALGYGRINNRQVVEVSYDFDEALRRTGIINTKLDDNTLLKLSELLYRQRDGEYRDRYEDDEMIELFRQIEATLLNEGYITGSLDAASTVRLYEILNNTSKKYVFYPKYAGYQVQGQVQYQVANESKNKPHEHYLSISGIYCLNLTGRTNLIFSGFFAMPLDTMAFQEAPVAGFTEEFQNYLAFLPDRNNLDFFKEYPGTGDYGKKYLLGLNTSYGVRADIFHSLSSVTGIQGSISAGIQKFKYQDAKIQYRAAGRFDYNIYSSLTAYISTQLLRETDIFEVSKTTFTSSVGIFYRIF